MVERETTVYCHGDPGRFPVSEFREDDYGALIHYIRNNHPLREREHYAVTGAFVTLDPKRVPLF